MTESIWTAKIIADDGCEQEATGRTPERALIALITDVMQQWNRDELPLDGDFLTEMGAMMTEIETTDWEDDTVFTKNIGDFSLMSQLAVERITEPAETPGDCPMGWDRV